MSTTLAEEMHRVKELADLEAFCDQFLTRRGPKTYNCPLSDCGSGTGPNGTAAYHVLRKEKGSLVSSLNRAEDRWLTLRDRLEGCVETWRRFEGREPEGIMLALKLMLEIIETERKES